MALVGASRDPEALGHRPLKGLLRSGFKGPVYPANPEARQMASVRVYPSVGKIGGPVELAVIAVPAATVLEVAEECGEEGVEARGGGAGGWTEAGERAAGSHTPAVSGG